MSVWEELPPLIEGSGADAVERLIDRAGSLAVDKLGVGEASVVVQGLEVLKQAAPDLGKLGAEGIAGLLARFVVDHPDTKARFVVGSMTFDQRRAASHAATAATVKARVDLEAAWDRVAVVLQDVGKVALKLLPFVLAAV